MANRKVVPIDKHTQARGRTAEALLENGHKPEAVEVVPEPIQQYSIEVGVDLIDVGENVRETPAPESRHKELVASIKQHGVIQPIRLRPKGDGRFEIVAGGRRFAAAKSAGLKKVPVVIGTPTDQDALIEGLVENLEREDLNPLDEAKAYQRLVETGLSQKALSARVGKSEPAISNAIRLLGAAPQVQQLLRSGKLQAASVKAMVSLPPEQQKELAGRAIEQKLSSKEVEAAASRMRKDAEQAAKDDAERLASIARYEAAIATALKRKGVTAKTTLVIGHHAGEFQKGVHKVRNPVVGAQYDKFTAYDDGGGGYRQEKGFKTCACDAIEVSIDTWDREGKVKIARGCILPKQHVKAFVEERDKVARAAAKANAKALATMTKDVLSGLMASETELSAEGHRLMLFRLYLSAGYGSEQKVAAFIRKFAKVPKGEHVSTYGGRAGSQLWTAIQAAPAKEIAERLVDEAFHAIDLDPFSASDYQIENVAPIRATLAETFGVDKAFVDGGRGLWPPKPETKAKPVKGDLPDEEGLDDLVQEGIVTDEGAAVIQDEQAEVLPTIGAIAEEPKRGNGGE